MVDWLTKGVEKPLGKRNCFRIFSYFVAIDNFVQTFLSSMKVNQDVDFVHGVSLLAMMLNKVKVSKLPILVISNLGKNEELNANNNKPRYNKPRN